MTRRDLFHKWLVYALGTVPVWLLDAYILPRFPVYGVMPMLLPLAVVAVAVLEGSCAGAGFGLGAGLLWALVYPGSVGLRLIALTGVGLLSGILSQYALQQSFPGFLLCSAGALALIDALRTMLFRLSHLAQVADMLPVAAAECALSLVWSPLVWLLFRRIYHRVGGDKLA